MPEKRILIAALGNANRGDDGAGPAILRTLLRKHKLPKNTDYIALKAGGMDLALQMVGYKAVVVVDALNSESAPGTVLELSPEEVSGNSLAPFESHSLSLLGAIRLADLAGGAPGKVHVVGIAGRRFEWGAMSPEVKAAVPRAAERVAALLAQSSMEDAS